MTLQREDELRTKFGLAFAVIDGEFAGATRRMHGFGVKCLAHGCSLHGLP